MVLTIQPHLAPRSRKEQSYTSAPLLGLRGLLQSEIYLLTFTCSLRQHNSTNLRQDLQHEFRSNQYKGSLVIVRQIVKLTRLYFEHKVWNACTNFREHLQNTDEIYRKSAQQTSSRYGHKDGVRGKYEYLIVNRPNYSSVKKLPRFCDTHNFIFRFKSA